MQRLRKAGKVAGEAADRLAYELVDGQADRHLDGWADRLAYYQLQRFRQACKSGRRMGRQVDMWMGRRMGWNISKGEGR